MYDNDKRWKSDREECIFRNHARLTSREISVYSAKLPTPESDIRRPLQKTGRNDISIRIKLRRTGICEHCIVIWEMG